MGGTGGASACAWCTLCRFGVDAVAAPLRSRLPERDRDLEPLRERGPSSGRFTVGTRDVLDTNVGSEMSFLRTARFMLSSRRTVGAWSGTGGGAPTGRGGAPPSVALLGAPYGEGRSPMGETGELCPEGPHPCWYGESPPFWGAGPSGFPGNGCGGTMGDLLTSVPGRPGDLSIPCLGGPCVCLCCAYGPCCGPCWYSSGGGPFRILGGGGLL